MFTSFRLLMQEKSIDELRLCSLVPYNTFQSLLGKFCFWLRYRISHWNRQLLLRCVCCWCFWECCQVCYKGFLWFHDLQSTLNANIVKILKFWRNQEIWSLLEKLWLMYNKMIWYELGILDITKIPSSYHITLLYVKLH